MTIGVLSLFPIQIDFWIGWAGLGTSLLMLILMVHTLSHYTVKIEK